MTLLTWSILTLCGLLAGLTLAQPSQEPLASNVTADSCEVTGCDRGTCNYAEGACRCQYGFRGKRCEVYALPSCSFQPPGPVPAYPPVLAPSIISINKLGPVSCMCLRELKEANGVRGQREVHGSLPCFVRVPSVATSLDVIRAAQHSGLLTVPTDGFQLVSTTLSAFDAAYFLDTCTSGPKFVREGKGVSKACQSLAKSLAAAYGGRHIATNARWRAEDYCMDSVFDCKRVAARNKALASTAGTGAMSLPAMLANGLGDGHLPNNLDEPVRGNQVNVANRTETCCPVYSGRCSADSACACAIGLSGPRCEAPCRMGCINECTGRGECLTAWCKCQPGWFGIDCSIPGNRSNDPNFWRPGAPMGPTPPPPRSLAELKIYVYDVPAHILQGEPCPFGCGSYCGDGIYKANNYFLSSLLLDSAHVTHNPNEAHLFLAPLLPYRYSSNLGRTGPHILDTIDSIRGMGFYDRNGGKDHIWWAVGDVATCDVPPEARTGIILGHYGRLDPRKPSSRANCMDATRDVVVPPISPMSQPVVRTRASMGLPGRPDQVVYAQPGAVQQARSAYEVKGPLLPRTIFAFVAASNRDLGDKSCADPKNNGQGCRDNEYGMGIRAALFKWFNGLNVEDRRGMELYDHTINEYYNKLLSSRFCFEMLGHGFSTRIVDYLASGCIPVIIKDDVLWPYESYGLHAADTSYSWQQEDPSPAWGDFPRVHYHEFALTYHKGDIPSLLHSLRGVSDERVREMQLAGQRIHKAFLWDQSYGMAYNYTMSALARVRASMKL